MWIGAYPFQLRKRSELAAREGLIPPPEGFTRTGTSRQPRTGLSHQAAPQKQRGVDMIAPRQQRPHRQDDAKQHQVDADLVEPAPRTDRPVLLENRRKDLKRPKLVSRSPPLMGASSASWRTTCTWQPPLSVVRFGKDGGKVVAYGFSKANRGRSRHAGPRCGSVCGGQPHQAWQQCLRVHLPPRRRRLAPAICFGYVNLKRHPNKRWQVDMIETAPRVALSGRWPRPTQLGEGSIRGRTPN
jgi:hypothetical protein